MNEWEFAQDIQDNISTVSVVIVVVAINLKKKILFNPLSNQASAIQCHAHNPAILEES
jgi:hypothetical protein